MSNKLTEYRNKCLTQLEKHVAVERKWFGELLQHQESSMQLQEDKLLGKKVFRAGCKKRKSISRSR